MNIKAYANCDFDELLLFAMFPSNPPIKLFNRGENSGAVVRIPVSVALSQEE
jgi:hypothetical protein